MPFPDYLRFDAVGLADLVRRGEVSPAELLEAAVARADAVHPTINAVVRRFDERARAVARSRAWPDGAPLAGVPFLVKDLMQDVAGEVSSCGSQALGRHIAPASADVTRRWEAAGLVIFGMTNTPEFGSKGVTEPQHFGPTRNPWDRQRTPGGSSGGAAAAVAAGIVPVAGANDGGGSIRIPASACGLFGLKPGRGLVSTGPQASEGFHGAVAQGVVSRSVRDSAVMLDILAGPEPHAPYNLHRPAGRYADLLDRPPRRLKIGVCVAPPVGGALDPDARAAADGAARVLNDLGHHVEDATLDIDGEQVAQDFALAWACLLADFVDTACEQTGASLSAFEPDTRVMAAIGRSVNAVELQRTLGRWHLHTQALARFHARYDLLLTPTCNGPAPLIGALATPPLQSRLGELARRLGLAGVVRRSPMYRQQLLKNLAWTPYTQLGNLTGRPAMSVPLHWTAAGLPIGVQFVGPLASEGLLLQLARELEQAAPWEARFLDGGPLSDGR